MSLTISELEEQRAKILEEIESKAGKISSSTPSSEGTPSLNDWLNAAEKVMPETPNTTTTQKSSYSNKLLSNSKASNKTSFFGVVIMLTLFLTLLGVLYIAYSSIHKELQNVLVIKDENVEQMRLLQADMKSLQQAVTTGGKTEVFNELELKVIALQTEVNELKTIIANRPLTDVNQEITSSEQVTTLADNSIGSTPVLELVNNASSNKVVTEAVLDQKLKVYTQQLEDKIDRKLEKILQHLTNGRTVENLPGLVTSTTENTEPELETPTVETVKTPIVEEPLLKLANEVAKPKAPEAPDAPLVNASSDVRWLMAQPKAHYTLQLASMPTEEAVRKIIESNQLKETKVLPQTRNKATNYILVTGSFASRNEAETLAQKIKSQHGISAWIRQVKDLTGRIQ